MDERLVVASGWRRGAFVCGCFMIAAGFGVAFLRCGAGPSDGGWGVDDHVGGSIAVGAALVGIGVVALLGRRRRPLLLFATGAAMVPICIVSVVLFPAMLVAAGMIGAAAAAPPPRSPRPPLRTALTIALVAALHVAAMFSLILYPTARTISTATSSSSTSSVITWWKVAISLGCSVLAVLVARTMPAEEPRLPLPPPPPPPVWTATGGVVRPR